MSRPGAPRVPGHGLGAARRPEGAVLHDRAGTAHGGACERRGGAARRAGDPVNVYADVTMAKKVLGWQSTRDLQSIIESAYKWHSTHPNGYR